MKKYKGGWRPHRHEVLQQNEPGEEQHQPHGGHAEARSREVNTHIRTKKFHIDVSIVFRKWGDILEYAPPTRYSYPHGQCRSVGVGGYLLGGGVNWLGTYNKVR